MPWQAVEGNGRQGQDKYAKAGLGRLWQTTISQGRLGQAKGG